MFRPFSLNLGGVLHEYSRPVVMGIINVTPDSFYAGSRTWTDAEIEKRAESLAADGADMIDVGAYSSRPGAGDVSVAEEIDRLRRGVEAIHRGAPGVPVSVDTFRAAVAVAAVEEMGADIVNDISGGDMDDDMARVVARMGVPYILMHMRGTPATMQSLTDYPGGDVTAGVLGELSSKVERMAQAGVSDIIVDPGFGFAKTLDQNYALLRNLGLMHSLGRPVLVGVSRKSMITRPLGITPDEALPGTVAVNTIALLQGASILRVHDVAAACQAVAIVERTTATLPLYTTIP
ncbi:MAG: dihydropteroate synthase [Muribaculaceae bacterium]|nr:dihydropteroate synthase [Muribaculaceae bacterium]